jgi:aryl-alcohol dehydrogenase-like predicted oxidoreductase
MTFGQAAADDPMASVWKTGQEQAGALVECALDAGINFFDAADMYAGGQSEEMLGRALGQRRKDVIISSKIGFRTGDAVTRAGASYGYILSATEACLRRLGTDYLDLLSIHKPDPFTPEEETARALDNLVQRGLVRYVGYSNLSAWQAAKFRGIQEKHGWAPFVAAQMYYSLVGRDLEHEVVPFCQDAGIGIVVWSPLASGFLSGRYTRQDPSGGGGRIAQFNFLPVDVERGYALLERMKKMAAGHNATVAQVALAWMLAKPFVSTILLGASQTAQLEDNLGALHVTLSASELSELDTMTAPAPLYPGWFHAATRDEVSTKALAGETPAPRKAA